MRTIMILLILALIGLQYKLWIGDGSISQWIQIDQRRANQEEENKQLMVRNHVIEADIAELKSGDQALEEQARFELGMVKNGEVYYQFSD